MTSGSFFDSLQKQYSDGLPFVAYSKPGESIISALLQANNNIYNTTDFVESGFVFAPFDDAKEAVLIPYNNSESIKIEFFASDPKLKVRKQEVSKVEKRAHKKRVKKGIKSTSSGELKKVVLSRKETIEVQDKSPNEIFKRLLFYYNDAFVYMWYHPKVGLWIGATPETLVSVRGNQLSTMALAGTQSYEDFGHVLWGSKEREEQQFVVDYIVASLKPNVQKLEVDEVEVIKAGNLLHLLTRIRATISKDNFNLKQIIRSLHPTPAICGLPREKAKQFILMNEDYNREYYTGFLGELNIKSEVTRNRNRRNVENSAYQTIKTVTNLYVNLRCMKLESNLAHIYVGGGITKDSVSKCEWRETVSKAGTMKKVL